MIMNLEDLQTEYKYFEEHICMAHSYLECATSSLNKFIEYYSRTKHYDFLFAEKLEENLLYLEMFYENIDSVLEYIENISLLKLTLPQIDNIVNIANYLPDNYEEDIMVDRNASIGDIFKKKNNLRLIQNDDNCSDNHDN